LQAIDIEKAKKVFNRLSATIAQHDFPRVGTVIVSIAIVEIAHQSGSTEIISQADQALYYAKEHGRNNVCCYENLLQDSLIKPFGLQVGADEAEFF
jgi:PleD family two-component response regulator